MKAFGRKLTGSKNLTSFTMSLFLGWLVSQKWQPWHPICRDIFYFSATYEQILGNIVKKSRTRCLLPSLYLESLWSTKMAILASDWTRHFPVPEQILDETLQETEGQRLLLSLQLSAARSTKMASLAFVYEIWKPLATCNASRIYCEDSSFCASCRMTKERIPQNIILEAYM